MRALSRLGPLLPLMLAATVAPAAPPTLEQAVRDTEWIGPRPHAPYWADDDQSLWFERTWAGCEERSLHRLLLPDGEERLVPDEQRGFADARGGAWDAEHRRKAWVRGGDLFLKDLRTLEPRQLTRTAESESSPLWLLDGRLAFRRGGRLLARDLATGLEEELAELRFEDPPDEDDEPSWLAAQNERLFDHLREREQARDAKRQRANERRAADPTRPPPPWYLGEKLERRRADLSPAGDLLLVTAALKSREEGRRDLMPVWITEEGYVEDRRVRAKVGTPERHDDRLTLLDLERGERHELDLSVLPGIAEDPLAFLRSEEPADEEEPEPRPVRVSSVSWSPDGERALVVLRSHDNKDRWVAVVERGGALRPVHRLHDPAWINWSFDDAGWFPDSRRLWFLSEESGWSNLYLHDLDEARPAKERRRRAQPRRSRAPAGSVRVPTATAGETYAASPRAWHAGPVRRLVGGRQVVSKPWLSRDGARFWFRANPHHPGVREIFRVAVESGRVEQLTELGGRNDFELSHDERQLVVLHSETLRPPELWLQAAEPGATPRRLTDSLSDEFRAVDWHAPRHVTIPSSHGAARIHARLFVPEGPAPPGGRPAVVFVHGAGYLQAAHQGWSQYERELLFHSVLVDRGFVVLNVDWRGSAGYGRDWRTAVYRDMGGPELEDLRDGVDWLVANAGVHQERVGAYGGSYGGFLVFMALFREPGLFAAGAALRPVTDWAQYSHGYTSNILNTPELDPEAYRRSSPIEHAAGLSAPLLICAPMIDDNVLFLDSVRLVQRLIELRKTRWFETAIYPVEAHSFREDASWLDEYRRILTHFERHLAAD